jgi:hypothetical protein
MKHATAAETKRGTVAEKKKSTASDKADKKAPAAEVDALGPRLQQILSHRIAPWKRDELGEEEAQLAEIKRRPVRHRFDSEEAKRRLAIKPTKKSRTSKPKQMPL